MLSGILKVYYLETGIDNWNGKAAQQKKGKLKIYVGMSAGDVGKTYRMLQDAHTLMKDGVNIKAGYIETQ